MVEVSEVERGLACGCVCPQCKRPLQANQGEQRIYFSHDPSEKNINCEGALETALHRMAKQILSDTQHAIFPEFTIKESLKISYTEYTDSEIVTTESDRLFEKVNQEVTLGDIRPDILAFVDGSPVIIEIAVTHFVDKAKRHKIRQLNLPAIEIDLSKVSRLPTKEELYKSVIKEVKLKSWIFNPEPKGVREKLKERLRLHAEKEETKRDERIYQGLKRKAQEIKDRDYRRSSTQPASTPSIPPKVLGEASIEPMRWIRCEACHHLFQIAIRLAPLQSLTIECLECGHPASGSLSSTGQLPT